MPQIGLGTCGAHRALNFAGGNIECGDQCLCAMPDIFEFPAFHYPRLHRQRWRRALQGLHAGHLIDGNGTHTFDRRSQRFEIG